MLRVMTIVGTRPELIRLCRTIAKLDEFCDHRLVHTGQNYDFELNEVFFQDLNIRKPEAFLNAAGETPAQTIANVISAADRAMAEWSPEALLILGDTNSSLAAISAKRRRIPIFHMEAGNRCFDQRVPEEINRKIVDHVADINLTYSKIAREYLLREGFPPEQVIVTGSPMREILEHFRPQIQASTVLQRLDLVPREFFVVSVHREENIDSPLMFDRLLELLNRLAARYEQRIIFSTHPRTRKRLDGHSESLHPLIELHKPFGFFDYIQLQQNARVTLSDSGTISEESSILNFPALNLREVHERPESFEEAVVMMVGLSADRVIQGINIVEHQLRGDKRSLQLVGDYSPTNVSEKVLRIIHSYTDFVNRRIWRQPEGLSG